MRVLLSRLMWQDRNQRVSNDDRPQPVTIITTTPTGKARPKDLLHKQTGNLALRFEFLATVEETQIQS